MAFNFYLENQLLFPLQIIAKANAGLQMVIVVPCRGQDEVWDTLHSLARCQSCCTHAEVILVLYSETDDPDEVLKQNARLFCEIEQWHRTEGNALGLFLLNFQYLPPGISSNSAAIKIGLDEGVQRLEDARNPLGLLMVMEPGTTATAGMAASVLAAMKSAPGTGSFQQRFGIRNQGPIAARTEAMVRYLRMGTIRSSYPLSMPFPVSAFAVRSMVYQVVGGLPLQVPRPLYMLAHRSVLEMPTESMNVGGIQVPLGQLAAALPGEMETVPHVQAFDDLRTLLQMADTLFESSSPNTFNQLAAQLPQPVLAYLMEHDGFYLLQELRGGCGNAKQFRRKLLDWLSPERIWEFLMQTAPHFYSRLSVANAIEMLVATDTGSTLPVFSEDYLLKRCKAWESTAKAPAL